MKKVYLSISILLMIIMTLMYMPTVKAADEYSFELEYTGDIVINETKSANVILKATDGPTYPRVRIKVDVTGPATPKVLATDSEGNEYDIIELGYWGPETGFAVGGTFENITPIKATFSAAGTYTVTLSLLNLDNNNEVITSKTETIEVLEDGSNVGDIDNDDVGNNTVEELPKTGTSITEYIIYIGVTVIAVSYGYYKFRKVKA